MCIKNNIADFLYITIKRIPNIRCAIGHLYPNFLLISNSKSCLEMYVSPPPPKIQYNEYLKTLKHTSHS